MPPLELSAFEDVAQELNFEEVHGQEDAADIVDEARLLFGMELDGTMVGIASKDVQNTEGGKVEVNGEGGRGGPQRVFCVARESRIDGALLREAAAKLQSMKEDGMEDGLGIADEAMLATAKDTLQRSVACSGKWSGAIVAHCLCAGTPSGGPISTPFTQFIHSASGGRVLLSSRLFGCLPW